MTRQPIPTPEADDAGTLRGLMNAALEGKALDTERIAALGLDDLRQLCSFLASLNVLRMTAIARLEDEVGGVTRPPRTSR